MPVAEFRVVEFIIDPSFGIGLRQGQGFEGFAQQDEPGHQNCFFPDLSFEQGSLNANEVTDVEEFFVDFVV